ncbi:MAG: SurA N-terminal domain-containing protein [Candidatus Omnitrophota bacterium]|jgi:peptidyl-prolyl cis-trans isomerase D|nr:SurA N-terminal domain-containing protein [Candidatus Omnitrophota bacterium]
MLKQLRHKDLKIKVLWTITVVIIISFGFMGTAYLLTGLNRSQYAGKIYGRNVTFDQFEKTFNHARIQLILHYGDQFNQIKDLLDFDNEAWTRLILLHEAEKRKITATDKEVVDAVRNYPFFHRDGQFDQLLYNDVLRYVFTVTPRSFEESIRDNLKIQKLLDQVTTSVSITDEEIWEAFRKQNEKVQASYVFINPDPLKKDVVPDEAQMSRYYQEHTQEFLAPPSINVESIAFRFPEQADDAAKDALKDQAQKVFDQLLVNPNMAAIAAEQGLTVEISDFFSMEAPDLSLGWSYDIFNTIFQLQPNEISQPLEYPQGIVIVKVKDHQEAVVPEFAKVQDKVKEALMNQEAKKLAHEQSAKYLQTIKESLSQGQNNFSQIAQDLKLEVFQTPVFTRGQYLPKIGVSKDFEEAAFRLNEQNSLSDVVEVAKGFSILHLDQYVPPDKEQYEAEKKGIAQQLYNQRRTETFGNFVTQLRLQANLIDNITNLREKQAR